MGNFTEWFENKLVVGGFPMPREIEKWDYKYIINVSDEYVGGYQMMALRSGKSYFWFPMNEIKGDMGVNSIYGALQILWMAEEENAKVYLHCHAGANRSPTIADCYYFMRTKTHRNREDKNNRLLDNIQSGNLPCITMMERFLSKCEVAFKKDTIASGGRLDWCKIEARF